MKGVVAPGLGRLPAEGGASVLLERGAGGLGPQLVSRRRTKERAGAEGVARNAECVRVRSLK
jgi:hypothetical protein